MVTDVVAAAGILAWPESKPVEVLDLAVNSVPADPSAPLTQREPRP